jgi:hypothetical protein
MLGGVAAQHEVANLMAQMFVHVLLPNALAIQSDTRMLLLLLPNARSS